jgi:hypothetical protein
MKALRKCGSCDTAFQNFQRLKEKMKSSNGMREKSPAEKAQKSFIRKRTDLECAVLTAW